MAGDTDALPALPIDDRDGPFPSYAGGPLPVADGDAEPGYDDQIARLVPARRSRAYDMKAVIRRLCDPGSFLELTPDRLTLDAKGMRGDYVQAVREFRETYRRECARANIGVSRG